jgi:uncharacterized membrane protein YccC
MVIAAPLTLASVRNRAALARPARRVFSLAFVDEANAVISTRVVSAVALASAISQSLGVPRSYWVVMVAGAVLQASHTDRLNGIRVAQRIVGTIIGVGVFLLFALIEPGFPLLLSIILLQFTTEVVVARNYALALVFITPTALIISSLVGTGPAYTVAMERMLDTLLGAIIALAVLWLEKWVRTQRVKAMP